MVKFLSAAALCLTTAGCDLFRTVAACDAAIRRAIEVDVIDARTGQWTARAASGFIRDGTYLDSLKVVGWRGTPPIDTATTIGAGLGRAGTYEVQVEHAGYRTWRQSGVRVRVATCSVETVKLRASLDPL
jgi:hypothetical protein